MLIRYGYEITFEVAQATPMVCLLTIHSERSGDIRRDSFQTTPDVPVSSYFDMFGNACRRFIGNRRIRLLPSDAMLRLQPSSCGRKSSRMHTSTP